MSQMTFSDYEYSCRKKKPKREEFLDVMEDIILWDERVEFVRPYYPSGKRGRPTILTTNQPFSKWTDVFGDAVIANAIIVCLVHHCEVIKITGNSYRIKGRKIFDDSDN